MNTPDNLQQLFDAAKRHQKDLSRQQKLSDLVDQWAAAEAAPKKSTKRRTLWLSMGIAAGILLMVSIGLRVLQPEPSANPGTIVAKIDTIPQIALPEPSSDIDNATPTTHDGPLHNQKNSTKAIAASSAERDIVQPLIADNENSVDNENSADKENSSDKENSANNDNRITPKEQVLPPTEHVLPSIEQVLPSIEQMQQSTGQMQLADNTITTKPKKTVYERTSSRLVGSKRTSVTRRQATDDGRPLLALTNSSTSITYELGKIKF